MKCLIPFTDAQLQYMFACYAKGASLEAIGLEFGVSKMVVLRRMKDAGIPRRRRGSPLRKKDLSKAEEIRKLLAQGIKKAEICERLSICVRTYYRRLQA